MFVRSLTLFIIYAMLLFSCGYALRGKVVLPDEMKQIYVDGGSASLRNALIKTLRFSSAKLVSSPDSAGITLNLIEDDLNIRSGALSSRGKTTEFEINYFLEFELMDSSENLLAPRQTVEVIKYYFNDQTDIVSKSIEERVIIREVYEEASRRLIDKARYILKSEVKQ